jgi:lipopolysaccharide/colanic/teichoic acid biosynthesis glycosyltransferase
VSRAFKRLFDICFSAAVLLCTLPLYPLIMLAIYREDGRPFFFAHARQTLGGRKFPCYKFRTMCRDAEGMKAQLVAANVADGPQFFIPDDPRLLRVGKLLRKFQLDELPQFWNVLLGHMSVVGPRPSPDKENQYSPAWREARLSVRPGVTGLWQVRRTREPLTDFQEWIRYDLEYVRHYSFARDMRIILETVRQMLRP